MAIILKRVQLGAYALFMHEPSAKESAEVSTSILNQIGVDIRKAKGICISIDRFDIIYRTPEDDADFERLMKKLDLVKSQVLPLQTETKWTVGIATDLEFLIQEEDQLTAFELCKTLLVEGISPEPFRRID